MALTAAAFLGLQLFIGRSFCPKLGRAKAARPGLFAFGRLHTEGFWSLLRSWLRPHRGISQEKLPIYLGFFQFVHNTRKRGKALLGSLVGALVT